ncbi:cerberus precursor [Xenopus laevis]|uniref:Cerberus n=2 Tax=Xenopus laevis TaxID=8355 RepID=CER1_XENLA|nr:cerberus precursor [Xenopus laevis]P70041.1 RecName: Full=Cerberus; Short=Cer; AltName: Full=Xcer; Contains: RecName: Full=Cerberus long; Short=Cer-L; Contains: RecName: Full=Cerberus short; Short=Cer-S; Flags: Precursor [Xenopus laevis]AAC60012.1 cerberus [Xenopus laevis]BAC54274.1 cerberus [Xenopus laevis]
MLLNVLRICIIVCLVNDGAGKHSEGRERTKTYSLNSRGYFRKERGARRSKILLVNTKGLDEPHIGHGDFGLVAELFDSTRTHTNRKEPDMNKVKLFSTVAHGNKSARRKAYNGSRRNIFSRRSFDKRNTEVTEKPGAKMFWNNFLVKMNGAPQNTSHGSKAQEIMKEACKTLPFTQNIVHENCDRMVIQNNLCFGKCISLHVPNQQDRRNTCSHCLPSKFTLNHLTLNCTGSKNVVKVVMMVEECTCEAHKSNFHQTAQFNMDTSTTLHH